MLSQAQLETLQAECHADDVAIDLAKMQLWSEDQARKYFESGGAAEPAAPIPADGLAAPIPADGLAADEARSKISHLKEEGNAMLKLGQLDDAVIKYRQALEDAGGALPPVELAPVMSNLAMALMKRGEAEASLAMATQCVAAKPDWHKAHFRMGEALFELRRFEEARDAYAKAEQLVPGDRDVAAARALADEAIKGGVWFRQLLPGREFAITPTQPMDELIFGAAKQMQNHIYLVGCAETRECYVVDACWDVNGIVAYAKRNKMRIVGAIGTHYHFDHCGGEVPPQMVAMVAGPFGAGQKVMLPGLREMARDHGAAVHIHAREVERIAKQCEMPKETISPLEQAQRLPLGNSGEIEVLHTPGHSGGSVCLCVHPKGGGSPLCMMSGDTIFPGSCGRLDLPDSDVDAMFDSLGALRKLDESLKVYPGHAYGGASTTIAAEKRGGLLRPFSKEQFKSMFAR